MGELGDANIGGPGDGSEGRAKALRRAGLTIPEIKAALGITSNRRISELLRGEPPQSSVRGRKAKVDAQAKARELRARGWSYNAIAAELGVAKSSVSAWCAGVILTEEQRAALLLPVAAAQAKRGASARAARMRRTELIHQAAGAEIGHVTKRELFLIGVALYWAEGSKTKPWEPSVQVRFVNSDANVIVTFLAWLQMMGVAPHALAFTLAIHERANIERSLEYWAPIVGVHRNEIALQLKRHNPRPKRHNVGDTYHGALVVRVRRSVDLNRRIEGWWLGIVSSLDE